MKDIVIGKKTIGLSQPTYFIADIAANHDGDIERAKKLIHESAKAGADAAKFQNFKANKIVSDVGFRQLGGKMTHQAKWKKSVFEVYQDASINPDWTSELKKTCDEVGIEYFTSPYDMDSVDAVDPYVEVYKIGSGDITWPEIIEHIAKKGKPVMIATGASELADVKRGVEILQKYTDKIVLMQCNTNYTGSIENFGYINLKVLNLYSELYPEIILGLSDHTPGHATVLGAVAMGARVVEKHFTDDNGREGPDHAFSMNPTSWKEMVDRTRELEASFGDGVKRIEENEKQAAIVQRRGLHTTRDLAAGETIAEGDLEALRPIPTEGIPPYEIGKLVGKKLVTAIKLGESITWKHVSAK